MDKHWDIIVSSGARSWHVSLNRTRVRLLMGAGIGALAAVILGVVSVILSLYLGVQNARLRARNAEMKKKVAAVQDLEKELAQARQARQKLEYMLGAHTGPEPGVPVSQGPAQLPPEAGSRSTNTVPRGLPVEGPITQGFSRKHPGVDIAANLGTPVVATAMGEVVAAGEDSVLGLVVKIAHPSGYTTLYGHLEKTLVKQGDKVFGGDIVGLVGETGLTTGPHLHYAVAKEDQFLDPVGLVQGK